jgi:hypothetical protein
MTQAEMDERDTSIGRELMEVLELSPRHDGRVTTTWGGKTPIGLARVVRRILDGVDEFHQEKMKQTNADTRE